MVLSEVGKRLEGSAERNRKDHLPCPTDVRLLCLLVELFDLVVQTVGVVDGSIYRFGAVSYQIMRRRLACCSGSASFVSISVNQGLASILPGSGRVATRRLKFCTLCQDNKLQKYVHACDCEAAAQVIIKMIVRIAVLLEVVSDPCRRSIRPMRLKCCS